MTDTLVTIYQYAEQGDVRAVERLIADGVDPNAADAMGATVLHRAAAAGHMALVRLLLDHGAHLDVRDENDWLPLHWAATGGHREVVELLLDAYVNAGARHNGWTAMSAAMANCHEELAALIEQYGGRQAIVCPTV